jgi:hypothetical protein
MKTSYYTMIFVVFFFITQGCENDDGHHKITVIGTGPIITRNLDLSSFSKIENIGISNFYITTGSPQKVVLKAQQNIIDVMTWEVVNQSLKVGLEKDVSIKDYEEIRFEITVPEINDIELVGIGDIELSGDDQSELSVNLTGVGSVKAYEMKVNTCNITLSGVGDCKVYVINELNVTIAGVGYVYYKGDPNINSTITGVGKLINAN